NFIQPYETADQIDAGNGARGVAIANGPAQRVQADQAAHGLISCHIACGVAASDQPPNGNLHDHSANEVGSYAWDVVAREAANYPGSRSTGHVARGIAASNAALVASYETTDIASGHLPGRVTVADRSLV